MVFSSRPSFEAGLQAAGWRLRSNTLVKAWVFHCRPSLEAGEAAGRRASGQQHCLTSDFRSRPGLEAGLVAGGWTALEQQNCATSWVFRSRPAVQVGLEAGGARVAASRHCAAHYRSPRGPASRRGSRLQAAGLGNGQELRRRTLHRTGPAAPASVPSAQQAHFVHYRRRKRCLETVRKNLFPV